MKMEKLQYSSPAAEIVNVRFERNFMQTTPGSSDIGGDNPMDDLGD